MPIVGCSGEAAPSYLIPRAWRHFAICRFWQLMRPHVWACHNEPTVVIYPAAAEGCWWGYSHGVPKPWPGGLALNPDLRSGDCHVFWGHGGVEGSTPAGGRVHTPGPLNTHLLNHLSLVPTNLQRWVDVQLHRAALTEKGHAGGIGCRCS